MNSTLEDDDDKLKCAICGAVLNSKPEHRNLGGDCLTCMAKCDDPYAIAELERLQGQPAISRSKQ